MLRTIAIALVATTLLSGCAVLAEAGLAEGALEAGAGESALAGAGGLGAAEAGSALAPIEVSSELEGLASEQGVLSRWLGDFARQGRNAYLEPGGVLRANGQRLASIDAENGIVRGRGGQAVGYISRSDGYLYEYTRSGSTQAVGVLEGWVPENGVRLSSNLDGSTGVEVLQPNVVVRVTGIGNGQYLVTLPNGASGWLPASALSLMILALGQQRQDCPDDGPGAIIRKSGEEILFHDCRKVDGAFILGTPDGTVVVDALDVDSILTGDRVPGIQQMAYADPPAALPEASTVAPTPDASANDAISPTTTAAADMAGENDMSAPLTVAPSDPQPSDELSNLGGSEKSRSF